MMNVILTWPDNSTWLKVYTFLSKFIALLIYTYKVNNSKDIIKFFINFFLLFVPAVILYVVLPISKAQSDEWLDLFFLCIFIYTCNIIYNNINESTCKTIKTICIYISKSIKELFKYIKKENIIKILSITKEIINKTDSQLIVIFLIFISLYCIQLSEINPIINCYHLKNIFDSAAFSVVWGSLFLLFVLWAWAKFRIKNDLNNRFGINSIKHEKITTDLERVSDSLKSEYSFAETRAAWLYAANAFFIGAFVALISADKLNSDIRTMLLNGLALFGALTSYSISVAIFLSHTLLKELKDVRKELENKADVSNISMILGLSADTPSHQIGHYGVRLVCALMCSGWIALSILSNNGIFEIRPQCSKTNTPYVFLTYLFD